MVINKSVGSEKILNVNKKTQKCRVGFRTKTLIIQVL